MADILVVDDDHSIVTAFERFLAHEHHSARAATNAQDALRLIGEHPPDLVIMDVRMPGMDGLQALNEIRTRYPHLTVVIMTAYGTSQVSIDAIRAGAFDLLTKPFTLDDLRSIIEKALATQRTPPTSESTIAGSATDVLVNLVGQTPVMLAVYKIIARLATNEVPALISGERGT
ncbi:MAG: response regulator, partial [Acidobacteriota bacterium]